MGDEEIEGHGVKRPAYDPEWQEQRGELKYEIAKHSDFYDYPKPVRVAVLMDLLGSEVSDYTVNHFQELYEEGEFDE